MFWNDFLGGVAEVPSSNEGVLDIKGAIQPVRALQAEASGPAQSMLGIFSLATSADPHGSPRASAAGLGRVAASGSQPSTLA